MIQNIATVIPSVDKLAPELLAALPAIKRLSEYATGYAQHGIAADRNTVRALITEHVVGSGVYSFPFYSPEHCAAVMLELRPLSYDVNNAEPHEAQIKECVLQHECRPLYDCAAVLWRAVCPALAMLLWNLEPETISSIQAAKYTPETTAGTDWHTDAESDVTLVVALTDTHEGGGTAVHRGFYQGADVFVKSLPIGHAMFFLGRTMLHKGLPVTDGERNLLVHWTNLATE